MSSTSLDRAFAQKASKWAGLITKNPARVVAALKLGPLGPRHTTRNEHGDSGEDFIFAMDAVKRVTEALGRAGPGGSSEDRKKWEDLVNAGAVEALCRNVCELKADTMAEDAMSSYYPPFVMLYFAAMGVRPNQGSESDIDSLPETDKRVLNVIKNNWREMMNRWWNEPQNTLKDSNEHEPERLVVSRLLGHLLIHDSSVYEIILDPSDNTLALISRHWAHSTTPTVARSTVVILRSILFFNFSSNVEEYLKSHEKPSSSAIVSKLYNGIGSDKPEALLEVMSSRLALRESSGVRESNGGADEVVEYAVQDLVFAHDLYVNLDSAFGAALRQAEEYWKTALVLMLRTTEPTSASPSPDAASSMQLAQAVLNILLKMVLQKPDSEVAEVTQTWIRAGLFDVFDEKTGEMIRVPGVTRLLTFLFTSIKESAHNFPPELLSLLKNNLPRQRTVAAVMKYDMELQGVLDGAQNQGDGNAAAASKLKRRTFGEGTAPDEIPDAQDPLWANGLWQAMGWLQGLCHSASSEICMRRTCGKKVVSRCSSCKQVGYCGPECQKLDWKEHKQLCKWAVPYMNAVSKGPNRITREKAAEMGLIGSGGGLNGNETATKATTPMDQLKNILDYTTPAIFLMFVVAGQYFGIFDDLWGWVNARLGGVSESE
ncbi:hypothetical protein D9757_006432 [Collybiopsis confluens]|uniref:MYND-type domain-containing protein n=1 Tax=Collybiopsis confluens TaxID=2823264 RepID=A0A8H5M8D0_9AGAR|nr:hypothetical protein D9757_006432 [Collybiopsis confluens]